MHAAAVVILRHRVEGSSHLSSLSGNKCLSLISYCSLTHSKNTSPLRFFVFADPRPTLLCTLIDRVANVLFLWGG
jgi:hypothetical protein